MLYEHSCSCLIYFSFFSDWGGLGGEENVTIHATRNWNVNNNNTNASKSHYPFMPSSMGFKVKYTMTEWKNSFISSLKPNFCWKKSLRRYDFETIYILHTLYIVIIDSVLSLILVFYQTYCLIFHLRFLLIVTTGNTIAIFSFNN